MTRNRFKELLLSLAAGQAMVSFGDNGRVVRQLSERIRALRAAEAAADAAAERRAQERERLAGTAQGAGIDRVGARP